MDPKAAEVKVDTSVFMYDAYVTFVVQTDLVDHAHVPISVAAEIFDWAQRDEYGLDAGVAHATSEEKSASPKMERSNTIMQSGIANMGVLAVLRQHAHSAREKGSSGSSLEKDGEKDAHGRVYGLLRFQFLRALVKQALAKYYATGMVTHPAVAVEKMCLDHLAKSLPPEARLMERSNSFREHTLYKMDIEAAFLQYFNVLRAIFYGYARSGPCGSRDLMSLSEWLEIMRHLELYDPDFTPREATIAFQFSRMRVVDEIKSRIKMSAICFVDFLEAILRVACRKRLPTDDILSQWHKRSASELIATLRAKPGAYDSFLVSHKEHCMLINDPVGQPPVTALRMLLDLIHASVAERLNEILPARSGAINSEDIVEMAATYRRLGGPPEMGPNSPVSRPRSPQMKTTPK